MLITLEKAKEALAAVVESVEPEYRYPSLLIRDGQETKELFDHAVHSAEAQASCTYLRDGRPSCLVGRVLVEKFNVPLEPLRKLDQAGKTGDLFSGVVVGSDGFLSEMKAIGVTFTEAASRYLRSAQARQDGGGTWFDSKVRADRVIAEYPAYLDSEVAR